MSFWVACGPSILGAIGMSNTAQNSINGTYQAAQANYNANQSQIYNQLNSSLNIIRGTEDEQISILQGQIEALRETKRNKPQEGPSENYMKAHPAVQHAWDELMVVWKLSGKDTK